MKKILAGPISEIAREVSSGLVTITSVRMTADLQIARVYVSIFGKDSSPGDILSTLENRKGELRHIVGQKLRLRFTPDLSFFLDDTLDQMEHIKKIIDSVKPSNDGK